MILQTLIWGQLKPWRNPSGDNKSGIWCLNELHFHWYSVESLGIIKLFKGDFYFIAWGKINARCNILKFIFFKCHILVLEKGLLFQNLTHVMQFVVKHDSFLNRKPFHCQIHMGRRFCFPGCRDSRQAPTTRIQSIEKTLSVGCSGKHSTFQTIHSDWNPPFNKIHTKHVLLRFVPGWSAWYNDKDMV